MEPTQPDSALSPTGVRLSADFRDNLIIDRHDPLFVTMRASKLKHLRSENSEDAVTWNVFRSLRQIDPTCWLPDLVSRAFEGADIPARQVTVSVWTSANPPVGLLPGGDEAASEVDVVIEGSSWAWFIEAKYRSDISRGTTTRPLRDQVLRNIDVGSYYAGVREFYFSLLVESTSRSPRGVEAVERYKDFSIPRSELRSHRPDGLSNLRGVGILTWANLGHVLSYARRRAHREAERAYAARAMEWMTSKNLHVEDV